MSLITMKEVTKSIEDQVKEAISAEEFAIRMGYNPFYFQKLFMLTTGMSFMAYVRERRMEHARMDLKAHKRVIDVALSYGYASERAFSRAFKHYHGLSPSASRRSIRPMKPPVFLHEVSNEYLGGMKMSISHDIKYRTLETMKVLRDFEFSHNPEEEVIARVIETLVHAGLPDGVEAYGFDVPVSEEEVMDGIRGYEYWARVPDDYENAHMDLIVVPERTYATLSIKDPFADPFDRIPNGWKALVAWVHEEKIEVEEGQCLEHVYEEDGVTYMDVMIPVKA